MAPKRRAAQPVTGITAASASMYPVTTHWICAIVLCSSRPSVASATLTIVVSRIDMTEPTSTTALTLQTCASMRSEPAAMRSHQADRLRRPENATVPKGQVPKQRHARAHVGGHFRPKR